MDPSCTISSSILPTPFITHFTVSPLPYCLRAALSATIVSSWAGDAASSYRPPSGRRIRFLSHPNDKPILSSCIGHLQTGRQHDGCVLRHSFCNVSCAHNAHPPAQYQIASTSYGPCNTSLTSTMTGSTADLSDEESPAMVALSSLPLDYFPGPNTLNTTIAKDKDRDRRSSQDETAELEVDIEVYNPIASCNATSPSKDSGAVSSASPKSVPYPLALSRPSPIRPESPTQRTVRSRLTDSWSTSITNFSPCIFSSVSPSSSQGGARNSISVARALSECHDFTPSNSTGCGYPQRWSRTRQHTSSVGGVVGVACSVPWDAAATAEKPRTGRLYSSREEIREAALKAAAAAVAPLSSLPSGEPSPPPSASPSDDEGDDEAGTAGKNYTTAAADFHPRTLIRLSRLCTTFQCYQTVTDVAPQNSTESTPPQQTSACSSALQCYVNLGPHSPVSTSATSVTSSATSPATAITSSSSSHSTSNYLSYSPYVPLSRQRSANSGHWRSQGRGGGRMRTLSSGQPPNTGRQVALSLINPFCVYFQHSEFSVTWRNPLALMRQTTHDESQHLTSLSQVDHTNDSSPSDLIDAAKLTTLQPERLESHELLHEEDEEVEEEMVATTAAEQRPSQPSTDPQIGQPSSPNITSDTSSEAQPPNYVVIDFRETNRALSQIMQGVTTDVEIIDAFTSGHPNGITSTSESRIQSRLLAERHLRRLCSFLLSHRMMTSTIHGTMRRPIEDVRHQQPGQQTSCSPNEALIGADDDSLSSSPTSPRSVLFWWIKRRRSSYSLRNSR
ncbi:hypothetical protein ACTXT7_002907 [Hymenolepis weldensis]